MINIYYPGMREKVDVDFTLMELCSSVEILILIKIQSNINVLLDKGSDPVQVCLWPAVVCKFFTLCRKDFTTGVQVTMKVRLLKLGAVKQGRAEHRSNRRA